MGGGCVCDNYISNYLLKSNGNVIYLENGYDSSQQSSSKKISNKSSQILYNILEANQDSKDIKRNSDFIHYEQKYSDKNLYLNNNLGNKVSVNEGKNTSVNDASFSNQQNINNTFNEDNNKKLLSSMNNSSNNNESNIFPTGTKQLNEEANNNQNNDLDKDNNNTVNNNITKINNANHNTVMKKIKEKKEGYRKTNTNINCNLGENNFIFINIHKGRGSSIINKKDVENIESTTPKLMVEKEQFEEITKGKKNLFSHYIQNRMNEKSQNNKIIKSEIKFKFDMNKYSEETLNIINSIRLNPEYIIKHIDYLIDNNIQKTDEGIFLINQDIDEKIKLMDNYLEIFNKTKNIFKEIIRTNKNISKLRKFIYKDELEITLDKSNNNDSNNDINEYDKEEGETENDIKNIPLKLNLIYDEDFINFDDDDETEINQNNNEENSNIIDLDCDNNKQKEEKKGMQIKINNLQLNKIKKSNKKVSFKSDEKKPVKKKLHNINKYLDLNDDKIGNLLLEKRKKIKGKYPLNIFKISVIKDIKMSILFQIIMEESFKDNKKNTLKRILFSPDYKYFAISWTNEINRNFISISCFA